MYCGMSDKKISLILCHLRKQQKKCGSIFLWIWVILLVLLFKLRLRAIRILPYSLVACESSFYVCVYFKQLYALVIFFFDGREIKPRAKKRLETTLCCPFSLFYYDRQKNQIMLRF